MKLAVGCPVMNRAWVLEHWFEHLALFLTDQEITFYFLAGPSTDNTNEILRKRGEEIGETSIFVSNQAKQTGERDWGDRGRMETMARMRNRLLEYVSQTDPTYDAYLSLDSDILVPPVGFMRLAAGLEKYDAVSPLVYLHPTDPEITNAFYKDKHAMRRVPVYNALQPADVLCAAKLMGPRPIYDWEIEYTAKRRGEDFGWSESMRNKGATMGIDTGIKCKHIMSERWLTQPDPRVGW